MRLDVAGEADIPALVVIGEKFFRASKLEGAGISFDADSMRDSLLAMLAAPDTQCLFVARDDKVVAGVIGGQVSAPMMNHDMLVAQESFWWVEPDYRKRGVGEVLYGAFEEWAKRIGATVVVMATVGAPEKNSLHDGYLAQGFLPLERHYFRALPKK